MHAHKIELLAAAALLVAGGCGGLTNGPFVHDGNLVGIIDAPVDVNHGWVQARSSDATSPALTVQFKSDGHFEIEGLRPGQVQILASTGLGRAVSRTVTIFGDRDNVFHLTSVEGASVAGIATLDGDANGIATVVGVKSLPVSVQAGEDGRFRIDGLPAGCYQIYGRHPTHHESTVSVCLSSGKTSTVSLHLLASTTPTAVPLCQPCVQSGECGTGGRCVLEFIHDVSEFVCSHGCTADTDCPGGYTCQALADGSGEVCLPASASCTALRDAKAKKSCAADAMCSLAGSTEEDGLCVSGTCTLPCSDDSECLDGTTCSGVSDTGVNVCR